MGQQKRHNAEWREEGASMSSLTGSVASTSESEQRILELLRTPAPRSIPRRIARSAMNPIAGLFILLGIIMTILSIGLGLMRVLQGRTHRLAGWLILGLLLMASLILVVLGKVSHRRTARLLSRGTLYKGCIRAVSSLPARVNGRWFFRVRADVHLPDGVTVTARDTVDNWAVEYFLDARDQQKEVDVLFSSDTPHRVVLPARIAVTRRFD
jgi:hypothetical protein